MSDNYYPVIDKESTANMLKALMICCKLKPTDIQEYLGLSCVQTVYRWMEGVNIPSTDHLYALCNLFGVRLDDILKGTNTHIKKKPDNELLFYQKLRLASFYLRLNNKQ